MSKKAPEGTQAVIRSIRLLKALSRSQADTEVGELAASTGLARTTAHRLLAALVSEGLVARNPATGTYRIGPGVIALGARALLGNDLRALVQPELQKLATETGESCTLEILADDQMLILAEVTGRFLVSVTAEAGTSWPVHATSTGKAVLACLSKEERVGILKAPLRKHTPGTITSLREFDRELGEVRERGYATCVEELEVGAAAVAVALREPATGQPVAAISINAPANRLGSDELAALGARLIETSERLSAQLG
jgi:IclR family acetate operon transcriptional repressor